MYFAFILAICTVSCVGSIILLTEKCPDSARWGARAAQFECNTEKNETYHCILNVNNHLVETCMKRRLFHANGGSCPWVFTSGTTDILFGRPLTDCKISGCPSSSKSEYFFSDELYKYPECFVPTPRRGQGRTTVARRATTTETSKPSLLKKPQDDHRGNATSHMVQHCNCPGCEKESEPPDIVPYLVIISFLVAIVVVQGCIFLCQCIFAMTRKQNGRPTHRLYHMQRTKMRPI